MVYLLLLLFLSACNLGPELVGPVVPIPEEWKGEGSVATGEESPSLWWEVFEDETLHELELQAISASPTLEAALYRVEQAWAQAGIGEADLFPQLALAPIYGNSGPLIKLYKPPGNLFPNVPFAPYRIHQLNYVLPINLSYELDLWGRIRKQVEAGCLSAEAEESAYRAALLSLTSQVASSYFNLRMLSTQLSISNVQIEQRKKALSFYEQRYQKGIAGLLDVESSKTELANLLASTNALQNQVDLESNRLAMLIGSVPSEFCIHPKALEKEPPPIPPGIPSTILINRPDISEAELSRASDNARTGAALASFFPSFSLTAALGFISPTTADFLKWESRYWDYGANANQTLFDGGRKESNYEYAWARFDEADANYRQIVIQAFREVEDALSTLKYERERAGNFKRALDSSVQSLRLSQNRFEKGLVPTIEVIDKERLTLDAELNSVASLGNQYQATIQLIKALGGSW